MHDLHCNCIYNYTWVVETSKYHTRCKKYGKSRAGRFKVYATSVPAVFSVHINKSVLGIGRCSQLLSPLNATIIVCVIQITIGCYGHWWWANMPIQSCALLRPRLVNISVLIMNKNS